MKRIAAVFIAIVLSVSMAGCSDGKSVTDSQEYQNLKNEYDKLKNEIAEAGVDSDKVDKKLEDMDNALNEMEQATSENNVSMNIKKGQVIEFGSYDGDKDKFNRKEPIEWIVLDVDDKEGVALLLSKYCLEKLPYNEEYEEYQITWETCTLRKWLNGEFYDEAFNSSEKQRIMLTTIENPDNPEFGTLGGNDTKDRVFLLSYSDMINNKYGFSEDLAENDLNRRAALAEDRGIKYHTDRVTVDGEASCDWWLRSPGMHNMKTCLVFDFGSLYLNGGHAYNEGGVRPALYINLNS